MNDIVLDIYNANKLIMRAVDLPNLHHSNGTIKYDCSIWANEFAMMMNNDFESVSSTLLIPNIGIHTYKNAGFLVNLDLALVQHIAISDSGSNGSYANGDFNANIADYNTIEQLSEYIKQNNHTTMNEVNLAIPINSVVGLVQVKCNNKLIHLKRMIIVKECIYQLTGINFDIYEYDMNQGNITKINLTDELIKKVSELPNDVNDFDYWTDYSDELYEGSISKKEFNL